MSPRAPRRRLNPLSAHETPAGHFLCLDGSCDRLLPDALLDGDRYECPGGHAVDLTEREALVHEPGGWTHVGLTCRDQGIIGEQVVQDLGHLGDYYGRIAWWSATYRSPLDGATDLGWGIEVKSVSTRARNLCFDPGTKRSKARKDQMVAERGWRGIAHVLVVLDFAAAAAAVHVRGAERARYFEHMGDPIARGIPFASPFEDRRAA